MLKKTYLRKPVNGTPTIDPGTAPRAHSSMVGVPLAGTLGRRGVAYVRCFGPCACPHPVWGTGIGVWLLPTGRGQAQGPPSTTTLPPVPTHSEKPSRASLRLMPIGYPLRVPWGRGRVAASDGLFHPAQAVGQNAAAVFDVIADAF